MSAWGRSGRVEIVEQGDELLVMLDDHRAGEVLCITGGPSSGKWFGSIGSTSTPPKPFGWSPDLPSRDAAIRWVLRRVAAKVWVQERGPVWAVRTRGPWTGHSRYDLIDPEGRSRACHRTWRDAMDHAWERVAPS